MNTQHEERKVIRPYIEPNEDNEPVQAAPASPQRCGCGMPWDSDMDVFGCWSCGARGPQSWGRHMASARTLELFDKPRRPRQWRMHVSDAGDGPCCCDETPISVRYKCWRCGHETGWQGARTVTEAKRGVPCPVCNA